MPFWLAGNHLIRSHGRVGDSEPVVLFVDTGLAGGGFTCPQSTIDEARIKLPDQSFQGMGGGGPITVTPFVLPKLSLGEATGTNIPSFFGAFPESLEHKLGFRIAGLVSHGFFRRYSVTLDFDTMTMHLDSR